MGEKWRCNVHYGPPGTKIEYEGILYELIQAHTSQMGWEPSMAPSLWRVCRDQSGVSHRRRNSNCSTCSSCSTSSYSSHCSTCSSHSNKKPSSNSNNNNNNTQQSQPQSQPTSMPQPSQNINNNNNNSSQQQPPESSNNQKENNQQTNTDNNNNNNNFNQPFGGFPQGQMPYGFQPPFGGFPQGQYGQFPQDPSFGGYPQDGGFGGFPQGQYGQFPQDGSYGNYPQFPQGQYGGFPQGQFGGFPQGQFGGFPQGQFGGFPQFQKMQFPNGDQQQNGQSNEQQNQPIDKIDNPETNNAYQWIPYRGIIPKNALGVANSQGKMFYVARCEAITGLHPGYLDPEQSKCYTTYDGKEFSSDRFEILMADPTKYRWFHCTDPSYIEGKPIIGGYENTVRNYFVCKCEHKGIPYFGKTTSASKAAYFGLKGKEYKVKEFDVLTYV